MLLMRERWSATNGRQIQTETSADGVPSVLSFSLVAFIQSLITISQFITLVMPAEYAVQYWET